MSDNIDHLQWEENFLSAWYTSIARNDDREFDGPRAIIDFSDPAFLAHSGLSDNINDTTNQHFYDSEVHQALEQCKESQGGP